MAYRQIQGFFVEHVQTQDDKRLLQNKQIEIYPEQRIGRQCLNQPGLYRSVYNRRIGFAPATLAYRMKDYTGPVQQY